MMINQNKWHNYILLLSILFSMLFLRDYKVVGVSAFLMVPLLLLTYLLGARIFNIKLNLMWIKKKLRLEWIILVILFWTILRLLLSFLSIYLGATVNRNFMLLTILSCFLYIIFYGTKFYGENWMEVITISGGIGVCLILLAMIQIPYISSFVMIQEWYWESVASYILLPIYSSTVLFCTTENRKKQILSYVVAIVSFFTLFLNDNKTSHWIVLLFLLGLSIVFRPRASLIKNNMILLFTFIFLWCNMALITTYVEVINWPVVSYDLESGVYGELILAVAGIYFFHFWDHIPEGKEIKFISMIGFQRSIRKCFAGVVLLLSGFLLISSQLEVLRQNEITEFIISLIRPLRVELQGKYTSFLILYNNTGILITLLILLLLMNIGKKIYTKIHKDKIWTNYLFLFYLLFMAQFFLLDIADQVVLVNIMLLLWGLTIEEVPLNIKAVKIEKPKKIKPMVVKEMVSKEEESGEEITKQQNVESEADKAEEKQSLWKRLRRKKPDEFKEEVTINSEVEEKEEADTASATKTKIEAAMDSSIEKKSKDRLDVSIGEKAKNTIDSTKGKKEVNAMKADINPSQLKNKEKKHFFKRKRKEETAEDEFLNSNIVEERKKRREQTKEEILSLEEELKQALEKYEKSQSESSKKFEQLMRKEKRGVEK